MKRAILDALRTSVLAGASQPSLDDGRLRLSRYETYEGALALARELVAIVPAGARVGLYLGNDALFAIGVLACAAAGCTHVALDTGYPEARNVKIARIAGIAAIVERRERPFAAPTTSGIARIVLDAESFVRDVPRHGVLSEPPRAIGADEPFAILFTSGSTGAPKGIVHSQRSLLASVEPDVAVLGIIEGDRCLGIWSPSTIAGLRATLSAIEAGALAVVRDPRSGLRAVVDTMRAERVTIARAVPALMRAIARVDGAREALHTLRVLQLGGERVYGTDIALLRPLLPPTCRISIGFGSTEVGVVAQWFVPNEARGVVGCGFAVPGATLDVRRPDGVRANDDEPGELHASGPATALGIWDGERARTIPFTPVAGTPFARTFATGDLFRRESDGLLIHAGRLDRMLKIRGRRVDAGDVEAAVRACANVCEAAVIARVAGDTIRLVAFVVPERGTQISSEALRRDLRDRLPEHMIPADVHALDELPYLPGFKPDFAALERLASARVGPIVQNGNDLDARDAIALATKRVWSKLLGRESFHRDACWVAAGGDSLNALRLAFGLERILHRPISLDLIHGDLRPSQLIEHLRREGVASANAGPGATTLVLVPGLEGDEPRLVAFRTHLRGERVVVPAYPAWRDLVGREASLASIAADVAAQITSAAATGPLAIVGYSFGGLVAHESARRLIEAGRDVAFVALLDTSFPGGNATPAPLSLRERAVRFVENARTSSPASFAGHRLALTVHRWSLLERWVASRRGRSLLPSSVAFAFHYHMTWFVQAAIGSAWRPRALALPLTIFRARDSHAMTRDLAWEEHASRVTVEVTDGDHTSMLSGTDGERLAARIRALISEGAAATLR